MSMADSRVEVIEHLVDYVTKKLPHEEGPHIKNFIRQYYLSVSPEDLLTRGIEDLYGAVLSHWGYVYQRQPGEAKVRVFNPQLEKDGWQSTHSIIEISFDDMPFLVDSVSMALNRLNLNIHLIIHMGCLKFRRNEEGKITEVLEQDTQVEGVKSEAAIYVEIDRLSDENTLESIAREIHKILKGVAKVVEDWPKMIEKAMIILENLEKQPLPTDKEELNESIDFLKWLTQDHFTFLGYDEFKLEGQGENATYQLIPGSQLGILKFLNDPNESCHIVDLPYAAQELIYSKQLLMVGKTNIRSRIHRPVYIDFVSVKLFDDKGNVVGERRFMGLYTSVAYNSSPKQIPLLKRKVINVLMNAGFKPKSHADRAMLNILETLPRDDLFQANETELLELATGILHLQERQRVRLFVRVNTFGYFISCLVFVPREKYNSNLGKKFEEILLQGFNGLEIESSTRFSESSLARIHFVVRIDPKKEIQYNLKQLEQKLIEAGRTWQDDLRDALIDHCGEERGMELNKRYRYAFPAGYQESFPAQLAVIDINYFESLSQENTLAMSMYRPLEEPDGVVRFKLYRTGATIPLSDVVPILENMGLKIISERPYEITVGNGIGSIWINDYRMVLKSGDLLQIDGIKDIFQEAFASVWEGKVENDGFNHLVLKAKLTWREVMVLRAYAKYVWQTGFTFSQHHVEETLSSNIEITSLLVELFRLRFDPNNSVPLEQQLQHKEKIEAALEKVSSLNEDRILRRYLDTIMATIRTNYYQYDKDNQQKSYLSVKLQSGNVPELPLPIPLYEIFVYSPRVEAIHLRAAKVARGGIRWSDRREDFRTEILGLMKTQQVKNAVIVPMGAKGGFVVKKMPVTNSREQVMEEVIYCYQTLIRGLLDLTDNYQGQDIIAPINVVRYDEPDPYLVVAADKGTATFSDIANKLSNEYEFWLGDAFASGGSSGYDHKKMGITARGAWESVKRHFQELGLDPEKDDFTAVGVGDMAGDVFGNGMLLSQHIKLVAAFNHMHIFIDPNPDPKLSFEERKRLFELPRSSWADYNAQLISKGGGVYLRSAKFIELSIEAQKALDFHQSKVLPNELIRAVLKSPVDLFWNGGIGTYVKSQREENTSVGDKTNDALRVNGSDLRCKVVAEGGNLGFTQYGRVEYAQNGGRLNTDAIDNSGGVNCSDNEVNIKILLNKAVADDDLTEKQRNILLGELTEEVAELVLNNNRQQTKAISIAASQAANNLEMHGRMIRELEKNGKLDRALECLPSKEEIAIRKLNNQGLTRPELAVLMAYSKIVLKESILSSNLPEDPYFNKELEMAFPKPLQAHFSQYMKGHRLKREIIATQLSNTVINEIGISFINRLHEETGADAANIIRAYTVSREIFKAKDLQNQIDELKTNVETNVQLRMLHEVNRLIRRGARWLLKNRRDGIKIGEIIQEFIEPIHEVNKVLLSELTNYDAEIGKLAQDLIEKNVPPELAFKVGGMSAMFSALDIVEASNLHKMPIDQVSYIYYAVGNRLQLGWFRAIIKNHPVRNHWEALARATFRDDLDKLQRNLTIRIMRHNSQNMKDPEALITKWLNKHLEVMNRWEYFVTELKNSTDTDFTMFAIALRELLDMTQVSPKPKNNTE